MTSLTLECPKCGRTVPEAVECAGCGVVFAKIRDDQPLRPLGLGDRPGPQPARRRLEPVLGLLVLFGLAALGAQHWVDRGAGELEAVAVEPVTRRAPDPPGPAALSEPASPATRGLPASKRFTPQTVGEHDARRAAEPSAASWTESASKPEKPRPEKPRWVDPDSSWFQGAAGFESGLERARDKNQAVLVYFYTDWCGYCRRLESELLSRAAVQEYTKYLVKIMVNPEQGARERALANGYGVTGYPSVFVHPAGPGAPRKVRAMTRKTGTWRVLEPVDYVENLTTAAGERFGAS